MADFKQGDHVVFFVDGEEHFGTVESVFPKFLAVSDSYDFETYHAPKEDVSLLPFIYLDEKEFRKFARYEITLQDLISHTLTEIIVNRDHYVITLEDILCVVRKLIRENIEPVVFYEEWLFYFEDIISADLYDVDNVFYNRNTILGNVAEAFSDMLYIKKHVDLTEIETAILNYLEDENKPLSQRRYPDYCKAQLLSALSDDSALENASEDEAVLYKCFAEELCEKGIKEGLNAVGYGCYGGNRVFPCDWKKSEECMLRLIDTVDGMPDRAFYANTLGYIYYYGRTTDGKPDYEKAYKYFSLAAFNGIYEAEYKVADMYKNGYYVPKCIETAKGIVAGLYDRNLEFIQCGQFNCKFADIALRMGGFFENEDDDFDGNSAMMLKYYYEASFAIRMRMIETDYYGDTKVFDAIEKALGDAKKSINFEPVSKIKFRSIEHLFFNYLSQGNILEVSVKELSGGDYKITFKPTGISEIGYPNRLFITIPELDMCGLYDSFSVTMIPDDDDIVFFERNRFYVDEIRLDEFLCNGFTVFSSGSCVYEIKKPKTDATKYRFVTVKFNENDSFCDYLCDDENIRIGDRITVNSDGEEAEVTVTNVFEKSKSETSLPFNHYKKI